MDGLDQDPDQGRKRGRRLPVGAEVRPGGGVHFRVWAPRHRAVAVDFVDDGTEALPLAPEGNGYFSGTAPAAGAGTRYGFRLGDGKKASAGERGFVPDPASRFQPEGPHGPSQVVDPAAYRWTDGDWRGPASVEGQVIYELHVGTFTPEGTWTAGAEQLPYLADLGVTAIEVMPVAEFPGTFGWGYDGVDLFAPYHGYGTPDDFRRFVDRAHGLGLAVLLDVVYNHLGPDGNYLKSFSDDYFSKRHKTEWGEAAELRRRERRAGARVRPGQRRLLGRRVPRRRHAGRRDAEHLRREVPTTSSGHSSRTMRAAAGGRRVLVVGENETAECAAAPARRAGRASGSTCSGATTSTTPRWSPRTGNREAYYGDYLGTPQELVSRAQARLALPGPVEPPPGRSAGAARRWISAPAAFIAFLQNHDQIANSARGDRLHHADQPRAVPGDHGPAAAWPGRRRCSSRARSTPPRRRSSISATTSPSSPPRFTGAAWSRSGSSPAWRPRRCRRGCRTLRTRSRSCGRSSTRTSARRSPHAEALALHRDLLRLRREDPVFRLQGPGGARRRRARPRGAGAPLVRARRRRPAAPGEPRRRAAAGGGPRAAPGPAPQGNAGRSSGRAKIPATAGAVRHPPRARHTTGG